MFPQAREDGLVVQDLPGETVVYDLRRHRAHSLNHTAALVWRACDGETPPAEMARRLTAELGAAADEQVVWLALQRLESAHLLREKLPARPQAVTRRALARRLGLAGGLSLLLPVVTSIVAPTPALAAASCRPSGVPCTTGTQCCSGTCSGGLCT